jgi:hypothetical protein
VYGQRFEITDLEFRVENIGCKGQGLGFRV